MKTLQKELSLEGTTGWEYGDSVNISILLVPKLNADDIVLTTGCLTCLKNTSRAM